MFLRAFFFIGLFSSICGFAHPIPEELRELYAQKMHEAFFLQSLGRSTQAFYKSKEAYEDAVKAGESLNKLNVILELFRWYRKYGYAAGVMLHPSGCVDEYRAPTSKKGFAGKKNCSQDFPYLINHELDCTFLTSLSAAYEYDYESEWGKSPDQAKYVRQFMLGVGMCISGVFIVTINPPVLGKAGWGLCSTGFVQMYQGLSNGVAEWEKRVREIQAIESKTQKVMETK